jgi:hypothetical protein
VNSSYHRQSDIYHFYPPPSPPPPPPPLPFLPLAAMASPAAAVACPSGSGRCRPLSLGLQIHFSFFLVAVCCCHNSKTSPLQPPSKHCDHVSSRSSLGGRRLRRAIKARLQLPRPPPPALQWKKEERSSYVVRGNETRQTAAVCSARRAQRQERERERERKK